MDESIKVLITGDTHLGGGRVLDLALACEKEKLFGQFLNMFQQADLTITNLESPLLDKGTPIHKIGPNLKSPVKALGILKSVGFDLLTLANNHIMDYGEEGLKSTLNACSKAGIRTVGAGMNFEEIHKPFVIEINDISICIINITENEFSTANEDSPGAYALNLVQNFHLIKDHSASADYVIVIIHGGHENYPLPSPRMKETYRFFVEAGANAVIGHHPHCFSSYEIYKNTPVFYSIGNFLFDWDKSTKTDWNEGFMVQLSIAKKSLKFDTIPYVQNSENVGLRPLTSDEMVQFKNKISQLGKIIKSKSELERRFEDYCEETRNLYSALIEPHSIKYLHALRNRNLFPTLLSKRKRKSLLNLVRCESHRDVVIKLLDK